MNDLPLKDSPQTESVNSQLASFVRRLTDNMNSVVLGKPEVVRQCVIALLAGEHILLEDVPGVGKTLVAKALAKSIDGDFCRLQFTPDLLPSDIVGSSIFNSRTNEFVYTPGPIFSNIVLADEINRAPPRTQSALLEAMSDAQASVDGITHALPKPFLVIATQNPFEFEGVYPLPESQLDRFLLRISMGYPHVDQERQVLTTHRTGEPVDQLQSVLTGTQVNDLQAAVREVKVVDAVSDYLLAIVAATRKSPDLHVGVSTRGALSLYRASQAAAFVDGRDFVTPDDVKSLAVVTLAHRVIGKSYLQGGQREVNEALIARLLDETPTPE